MIALLLALGGSASAHDDVEGPPAFTLGDFEGWFGASLGLQLMGWVGDEADITRFDPVRTEGVRSVQSSLELNLRGPHWTLAHVRLEEGMAHAGGLESSEAELGIMEPEGRTWLVVGRGDLAVTWDRVREAEGLLFVDRPSLSASFLPLHVNSVRTGVSAERLGTVQVGLSWAAATSDAPYRWARVDLHPLGETGLYQDTPAEGLRVRLGAGALSLDSESLGARSLLTADGELQLQRHTLGGGWQRWVEEPGTQEELVRSAAQAFLGLQVLQLGQHAFRVDLSGERVVGLLDDEDVRLVGNARLAWQPLETAFTAYVGTRLSREQGSTVAPGEDVVDLGRGIERANDIVNLGFLARW